jgi:hypothetical protein
VVGGWFCEAFRKKRQSRSDLKDMVLKAAAVKGVKCLAVSLAKKARYNNSSNKEIIEYYYLDKGDGVNEVVGHTYVSPFQIKLCVGGEGNSKERQDVVCQGRNGGWGIR